MRILFLNHEYPPHGGGAAMAMKHLAEGLARQGQEMIVLTTGTEREECQEHGVSVLKFPVWTNHGKIGGWRTWLSFLSRAPGELRQAIVDRAPDIIHSFFVVPSGFLVAKLGLDLPHVTTAVGGDIHGPRRLAADNNPIVRMMARKAIRHAEVVTACSTDFENRIRNLFPSADVRQIRHPVIGGRSSEALVELPVQADLVISILGRLVPLKRIDLVFRAVASLGDPKIAILVMGDGPERIPLQQLSQDLGIDPQVTFLGETFDPEKSAYLKCSDVFCLTSDYESFGLVYVEAMLQGTPVIASAAGGPLDIVRDGVDGYLIAPHDIGELASRIRDLRDNPDKRKQMAKEAAVRAQNFSPDSVAACYVELYREIREAKPNVG